MSRYSKALWRTYTFGGDARSNRAQELVPGDVEEQCPVFLADLSRAGEIGARRRAALCELQPPA